MSQSTLLRNCRWFGYLSLCLLLCSWFAGCGGGAKQETADDKPAAEQKADEAKQAEATPKTDDLVAGDAQAVAATPDVAATGPMAGFSPFDKLMAALSIFVLAIFIGFEVITKVPPTLHTPLMSGSNAISGITLVGALLVAGRSDYAAWLGVLAVIFATVNVIGGFWVTHRMLSMFKR